MTEEERKRRDKERKERERKRVIERERTNQKLDYKHKYRSLHDKHRDRRKRDCMIGLPFIVAFQGDPARPFYCNDVRVDGEPTYELIKEEKQLARLARYLEHHVVSLHAKILIYKAS